MISLVDYLSAYTDNRYKHLKLSDERKEHLLNLDAEYGELVQLFRKRFNAKRVENLDEERNDILKYNVDPHHLGEINTIKQFLKINKFKSLI